LQLLSPANELLKLFASIITSMVALLVHSKPKKPAKKYSALYSTVSNRYIMIGLDLAFSIRSCVVVRTIILLLGL